MGPEAPAVRKKPEEVRKNRTSPKADFHKMGSVGPGSPEVARKSKTSPRADFHRMGSAVPEKMNRENPE